MHIPADHDCCLIVDMISANVAVVDRTHLRRVRPCLNKSALHPDRVAAFIKNLVTEDEAAVILGQTPTTG